MQEDVDDRGDDETDKRHHEVGAILREVKLGGIAQDCHGSEGTGCGEKG